MNDVILRGWGLSDKVAQRKQIEHFKKGRKDPRGGGV